MSDLIDGVVVEYFDIDYEVKKMKANEPIDNSDDIDALMDDDSGDNTWAEQYEQYFYNNLE